VIYDKAAASYGILFALLDDGRRALAKADDPAVLEAMPPTGSLRGGLPDQYFRLRSGVLHAAASHVARSGRLDRPDEKSRDHYGDRYPWRALCGAHRGDPERAGGEDGRDPEADEDPLLAIAREPQADREQEREPCGDEEQRDAEAVPRVVPEALRKCGHERPPDD
jgi:hypothetical protein